MITLQAQLRNRVYILVQTVSGGRLRTGCDNRDWNGTRAVHFKRWITFSKEDYWNAISEAEAEPVVAATLAHWLSVVRPAVTFALKRLTKR